MYYKGFQVRYYGREIDSKVYVKVGEDLKEIKVIFDEDTRRSCLNIDNVYLSYMNKSSTLVVFNDKILALENGFGSDEEVGRAIEKITGRRRVQLLPEVYGVYDYENVPVQYFSNGEESRRRFISLCKKYNVPRDFTIYSTRLGVKYFGESDTEKFIPYVSGGCIRYTIFKVDIQRDFYGSPVYFIIKKIGKSGQKEEGLIGDAFGIFFDKEEASKALCRYLDSIGKGQAENFRCLRSMHFNMGDTSQIRKVEDFESTIMLHLSRRKKSYLSDGEVCEAWDDFFTVVDKKSKRVIGGDTLTPERNECFMKALQVKFVQNCIKNRKKYRYVLSIWNKELTRQIDPLLSYEEVTFDDAKKAVRKMIKEALPGEVVVLDRVNEETGSINLFFVYNRRGVLIRSSNKSR